MGKAFGPRQHHHEKRGEGRCGIDVVGRAPLHWHVLPDLLDKTQLVKKSYQDRNPAQRRHGTLRLAQNHPLVGQQCDDLTRDWIVRYLWFHPPVVSNSYERQNTELRNSGLINKLIDYALQIVRLRDTQQNGMVDGCTAF